MWTIGSGDGRQRSGTRLSGVGHQRGVQQRALPLVWMVVKGSKGHFSEEAHLALLEKVQPLMPVGSDVIFLGDGEFDGVGLQANIAANQWEYVCRTACNRILCAEGEEFSLQDIHLRPGEWLDLPDVGFTQANCGPVLVIAWWRKQDKEPIYLVTIMELAAEACFWYRKRFSIETFSLTRKVVDFICIKAIWLTPNAWPGS